ncbi:glutathione S-transferase family protein [Aquibium carbonis]|uniref:Glutathione S-transferase family protein n=1 Tax=Aquibium carbonis TaxID=2495581 RepID=A0A429YZP2_9HYPH|nr:glutathione S-transferase family protein [Aquibium carbonis]RST86926.1 glutathione S-transferase family protein [Aquibium carbonis]
MLTIYAIPPSLYCAKLRIVLRHKNLDWRELPPPGGYGSAAYKQIVASGNLPAMLDGDLLIADSEAIAEYLEERYPEPPLLPQAVADRARMRERGRFHDTRLEPALRALFGSIGPDVRDAALNARQSAILSERLGQLGRMLQAGPDLGFGLGDCGYPITFAWIDALTPPLSLAIAWPEGVAAYRARIEVEPAVAAELDSYRPILRGWVDRTTGSSA